MGLKEIGLHKYDIYPHFAPRKKPGTESAPIYGLYPSYKSLRSESGLQALIDSFSNACNEFGLKISECWTTYATQE